MTSAPVRDRDTSLTPQRVGSTGSVAVLGDPSGRLLAGKPGKETFDDHRRRLGSHSEHDSGADLLAVIEDSGLTGRGGGAFPAARKLRSSLEAPGVPVVVINATESEPASVKDRLLLATRPHLVLDGAIAAASAIGADLIILAVHTGSDATAVVAQALAERTERSGADGGVRLQLVEVPDRYLSGESSALVSFLNGGTAVPSSREVPTSVSGVAGRPTVVNNAETVAHLALIARFGSEWFRQAGTPGAPGSVLLTFAGDVDHPGAVVEVLEPVAFAEAAARVGANLGNAVAVLLGGYGGRWVPAPALARTPVDPAALESSGTPIGCGLVGILGPWRCGLVEAGRILGWLAGESAGQCGACSAGLPELATRMSDMAAGVRSGRRHRSRLLQIAHSVYGRGLCHLPDGAISMMESSLVVFDEELRLHRRGRCSSMGTKASPFPLPDRGIRAGGRV